MKKKFLIGCIMLFLGVNTISVKADIREHRTTWDCIWFGRYPQTEISDVTSFTNKKYFNNSEGQQCGYVAKNKEGEKVTIGMVASSDERFALENRTGADKHFYYKPIKWRILKVEGKKCCYYQIRLLTSIVCIHQHLPMGE